MEQKREMTFEEVFSTIKQDGFLKIISADRHYRLGWFFFISNCFYQIKFNGYYYCYCDDYRSAPYCQICTININYGFEFEKKIDEIRFDIVKLRKCYYKLRDQLIKCFYEDPFACDCFCTGGEYTFTGRDYSEGTFWMTFLTEKIEYDDGLLRSKLICNKK